MNSYDEIQRQLRVAFFAIGIILPAGVIGFMFFEHNMSLLDAVWLTVTTLTTIGYGDITASTQGGRIFTMVLVIFGLGSFALAGQAAVQLLTSPIIREIRQRRRSEQKINSLSEHYIICGEGELVDKTINYLHQRAELRRQHQEAAIAAPIDNILNRVFGKPELKMSLLRRVVRSAFIKVNSRRMHRKTLLDAIVVVTNSTEYENEVRDKDLLVIRGDPTDDHILQQAGLDRAQAMMVMLESDMENLLVLLTARNRNPGVFMTAITSYDLSLKMTRVGANNVLAPYEIAGQFLNGATLRPAVNSFYNSILFDHNSDTQIVQLFLKDDSPWIGQSLGSLNLRQRFDTGIIGLRLEDGRYLYTPDDDYVLQDDEVVLSVTPGMYIGEMMRACYGNRQDTSSRTVHWQRLPTRNKQIVSDKSYSLIEAEESVDGMAQHFIICGEGPIIHNAIDKLDPDRPFVIISNNNAMTSEMLKRGFRVIHGSGVSEEVLIKAGVKRALAIMISIGDKADSVITVLNCRSLNKNLLITVTASTDDMIPRLNRAGADRVVSPFRIAAQFVLLATTRSTVSDFLQYVLYNYQVGIETTELYMQTNSPWIGKSIADLQLKHLFDAGVVGVVSEAGEFIYAPNKARIIQKNEILIVITPMQHSDQIRSIAHGGESKRPKTLRREDARLSGIWG